MAGNENPGALAGATGVELPCHEIAASNSNIARAETPRHNCGKLYTVIPEDGAPFTIKVSGREAWTLDRLIAAGRKGCTPIEEPAPRWSAYVHNLRKRGVVIETVHETHGGDFAGWHGRYVLRCDVRKGGSA